MTANEPIFYLRKSRDRGHFDFGWLKSAYTFSFGDYQDTGHDGYRSIKVINEDIVAPDHGFPEYEHKHMELVTVVISGTLTHKDSLGNEEKVFPGEAQIMSAGDGIEHSEFNELHDKPCHIFQIWISSAKEHSKPAYSMRKYGLPTETGIQLIASNKEVDDVLMINQELRLYRGIVKAGEVYEHKTKVKYGHWIQVISGNIELNGLGVEAGDGCAIENIDKLTITGTTDADFLFFHLT